MVIRNSDPSSSPMVHDNLVEDAVDENVEASTIEDRGSSSNND